MFEFGLPENRHLAVPEESRPEEVFILAIGLLGDAAARIAAKNFEDRAQATDNEYIEFSSRFFDAFLQSRFSQDFDHDTMMLASAAYYLADRPGSSFVMANRINGEALSNDSDRILYWLLKGEWRQKANRLTGIMYRRCARRLHHYFNTGDGSEGADRALQRLRDETYKSGSPRDLTFVDLLVAIARARIQHSTWQTLPGYTGVDKSDWSEIIKRNGFPKELWPSQMLLGQQGIFSGKSAVIQMPTAETPNDIALYLGIRVSAQGPCAIFCGKKSTASSIAKRAVDIYRRGFDLPPPREHSDAAEIEKLSELLAMNFGRKHDLTKAAQLGILVHHGNTPQGVRHALEFAMNSKLIGFVVCTSTLAQGVNLPIRYLIVPGVQQGGDQIKTRDFQNLIGRAGRSGMHTEGIVIFADTKTYDLRRSEGWRYDRAVELLTPSRSEPITSSLLQIIAPFGNPSNSEEILIPAAALCDLLYTDRSEWSDWVSEFIARHPGPEFEERDLLRSLRYRKKLLRAVESYLMANRVSEDTGQLQSQAESLAEGTLAYHLDEERREDIKTMFKRVAAEITASSIDKETSRGYSKTLLGISDAVMVANWVTANRSELLLLNDVHSWLSFCWPLLTAVTADELISNIKPPGLVQRICELWISGESYEIILALVATSKGTKPFGTKRRKLTEEEIVSICQSYFAFDCALVAAAIGTLLFPDGEADGDTGPVNTFQKALKYGLPDPLTISCYDLGFTDRHVAQTMTHAVRDQGYELGFFRPAISDHRESLQHVISNMPSYFSDVLARH